MIGLVIIALLVIILVIRPLLSRVMETAADTAALGDQLLADQTGETPALTGPGALSPTETSADEEHFEELIDIDRVEGRVKASAVKTVGEIVNKHPEEAMADSARLDVSKKVKIEIGIMALPTDDYRNLTGLQKAAIFMLAVGRSILPRY